MSSLRVLCAALVVGVMAFATHAAAQGGNAELNGTAYDESGAVLPGVTITATDETTGISRTTTANGDGRFVISSMVPGRYAVKGELDGFRAQVHTGVMVGVGQAITVRINLSVGGLEEQLTVTAAAPIVEPTSSRIGANLSNSDIDSLPSSGRQQLSLLQVVPGLTPTLRPGQFDGTQFNANGRETGSNLFMVDGIYNNDDRMGASAGTQARVTLDSMEEFQVLTHQYGTEYGGSSGVVVNAVTKRGSNTFHGRAVTFLQNDEWNATDYFLKKAGGTKANSGSKAFAGNIGGPILKNRAFFFFNLERNLVDLANNVNIPAEAAPLAKSYQVNTEQRAWNYLSRVDFQLSRRNALSFRWITEPNSTVAESIGSSTFDNAQWERSPGDSLAAITWTSIFGTSMVNEVKFGYISEPLRRGDRSMFDANFSHWIGLDGRDPLDFGAQNSHPDFSTGPRSSPAGAVIATKDFSDSFTLTHGNHTLKFGAGGSHNGGTIVSAGNLLGSFSFLTNKPFNPADATTYPNRFQMRLGEWEIPFPEVRFNGFASDKWQMHPRVTLTYGLRMDHSDLTPDTKLAVAPRLGVAWDPQGQGKMVVRGGFGKFYEYQLTRVRGDLNQNGVISKSFVFDSGQDNASRNNVIPAHVCLQPLNKNGLATISPACRALVVATRAQVEGAGTFINTEPLLPGDRKMGYTLNFSAGVSREIIQNLAVTVDYVGSRGRDQTGRLDINEPRLLANGTVGRPGVNVFDPDGSRIPAVARSAAFRRVLEYTTSDVFNSDFNDLEVSMDKRMSNHWSARVAYTLGRARDVNAGGGGGSNQVDKRVNDDLNPRSDFGLANFSNKHAVVLAGNVEIFRGLGAGGIFKYYSGNPINETVGIDTNGDTDTTDRPVKGKDDTAFPIRSALDSTGRAIRNGLAGPDTIALDLRAQYVLNLPGSKTVGFFLEMYNLTNRPNFGDITGSRLSTNFMIPTVAGTPRTTQIGFRFTF